MEIRKAVPEDTKAFHAFLHQLDQETRFMLYEPSERSASEAETRKRIEATGENAFLVVAEDEGKIVGFLASNRGHAKRIQHCAYIVVGMLQAIQGQGLGQRFFEELEKWAMERGILRLELTVMTTNERAIKLYKKVGFKIEGIKEKSCLVDGVWMDEYYMGKLLE